MAKAPAKASTRERILEVAFALFVERGFDGTPITEVERRVGLTPGTGSFYRHFPSKDALLRAVVEREVEQRMGLIAAAWDESVIPEDPGQVNLIAARKTLEAMELFAPLFRLMLAEGDRVPDLREAIASTLLVSRAIGGWVEDPHSFLGVAALFGFHVFDMFSAGALRLPDEDAFLKAVAETTPLPLPPTLD